MSPLQFAKSAARRSPRFMQLYRKRDVPQCRGTFQFDAVKMQRVVARNRVLLSEFGDWVDPEAMRASTFDYGLSPEWAAAMQRLSAQG